MIGKEKIIDLDAYKGEVKKITPLAEDEILDDPTLKAVAKGEFAATPVRVVLGDNTTALAVIFKMKRL